jgi:mono/diheme cytochrome c family protein
MRRSAFVFFALLAALAPAILTGCGGGETVSPEPETVEGTLPQEEPVTVAEGDAEAGAAVFEDQNCGSCHTFGPAGTEGTLGPNLDESLQGDDPTAIATSIVDPDAEVTEGFQPGVMPQDYGEKLDEQQLADLVAFLSQGS